MLPIGDVNRSRTVPVVTYALVAVNVAAHLAQMVYPEGAQAFVLRYGLVPALVYSPEAWQIDAGAAALPLLSFMFVHGGWGHLLSNMLFLWVFGDNVEDRMGHLRYLMFYLVCGLASGVGFSILDVHSKVPLVGASGAIAGVLGSYIILFPGARIRTLIPLLFLFFTVVEIPAVIFLGLWFVLQVLNSMAGGIVGGGGVAWFAHVFGFIVGFWMTRVWFPRRPRRPAEPNYRVWID